MPTYTYTARQADGSPVKGERTATSPSNLASILNLEGQTLISANEVGVKQEKPNRFASLFQRVSPVQKIFFTQNLSIMVKTGFPLSQALKTLALQSGNKTLRNIISALSSDVESGITLSRALAKYPHVFSELFINMIAAGEQSGKLDETLQRLTLQMRKDHALLSKVRGALTYPVIVVIAMFGIGIGMTVFIIPKLLDLFEQENATLPVATKVLIAISNFLITQGVFAAVGFLGIIVVLARIFKTERGRYSLHKVILKLPVAGPIVRKINLARFMRTLASLLQTDIPIIQSLQIIAKTLGNALFREAMLTAADDLKRGTAIVKSLERFPKLFPPMITQMLSVGEQSGTLDEVSGEIAVFYEEEIDQTMSTLSTVIEPILMLVLGVGVALMAIAIIMPIYSLTQQIA
jgi:type IV pilus assembly protein PilC